MRAHPIHPALVHLPFGLLLAGTLVDLAGAAGLVSEPRFAALLMAGGLAAALPAMAAGLWDFGRLGEAHVPLAHRHMAAMALALTVYAAALYLRRDSLSGDIEPPSASLWLGLAAGMVLAFGGWLGGELVYRHGAGRIGN